MKQQLQTNKIEWQEFELGDVCEIKKGSPITRETLIKGNIPVIAGGQQPAYYHNVFNRKGETITLSASGAYAGFVNYFNTPIFASDCSTIQAKENTLAKYIYYFLKCNQKKIYGLQRGIAQPHVYPKDLENIKIPLPFRNGKPDLEEQERIVAILEKAERLKEQSKRAGALLDEYLKSVFYEMFLNKGFEEVEISKGVLKNKNVVPERERPNEYFNYVDIASINSFSKIIIESKKILGKDAPSRARQLINYKDILVSTVRPNLNAVAMVPKRLDNQICSTGYCILRTDNRHFIPEYLFYVAQNKFFIDSLIERCKGANYPAVSNKDVLSIKAPLPPLALQKKFALIVEQVEKMKENVKKTQGNTDELFNSLMQKAFKGEL